MNAMRIVWSVILILAGLYVFFKINDTSDPSSFRSKVEELEKTLEDSEIP